MEAPTYSPTREEVEAESTYWTDMDRVAEYDSWFAAQAEAESEEDECPDQCSCSECRSAWDEYEELSRDYRRSTRGF
jgi:hypothetical protein